jgi:hypothetical protein
MELWREWWKLVRELRPAFSRTRTFLWFTTALAAMCVRADRLGVTSLVRALGLQVRCYDRLLDCFHSSGINLDRLTRLWVHLCLRALRPFLYTLDGRLVLLADGIKVAKSGRKMPAVKNLRQTSNNNTKPKFIFGHSCQALAVVVRAADTFLAVPLACRIHEGIKDSSHNQHSLFDKLVTLLHTLTIARALYMVADSYYAAAKVIKPLLQTGQHLITAVRLNAVAYERAPVPPVARRGRRALYGVRIKLARLFKQHHSFSSAPSPIYGEKNVTLRYRVLDLCWKSVGRLVRFVLVIHPTRGKKILLSTDRSLSGLQIIEAFGIRFKIEVCFKQAIYTLGTYAYHFWLRAMRRHNRRARNQYLFNKPEAYRRAVRRKLQAYHVFIQLGFIAQGLLQTLALRYTPAVWRRFGSWIRTIRPGRLPSEFVVLLALRHSLPAFLADTPRAHPLVKFLRTRIDLSRSEGLCLAA